jgi:hypothetical protein
MAYHFGVANTDKILANGPAAWTTKMSIMARLSLAQVAVTTRPIVYAASFFYDFTEDGSLTSNMVRIGYQDSGSGFGSITVWTTGFTAGSVHSIFAVIDTTLGSANVKLYADTDATPKATTTFSLAPLITTTGFEMGGETGSTSRSMAICMKSPTGRPPP